MKEILKNRAKFEDLDKEIQDNLLDLLEKINKIRQIYNKPMKVNDGLRIEAGGGSKKSNHLKGLAIDIDDDDQGTLWFWLMKPEQMQLLKDVGLWLEHGCWTHANGMSWVHLQTVPPKSNLRIFIPDEKPNPNPNFWNGKYNKKFN